MSVPQWYDFGVQTTKVLTQETPDQKSHTVTKDSPPADKIQLFRSLFRGGRCLSAPFREPQDREGRVCPGLRNEWLRGVCEKPRIKCADCPNRRFLPVTDEVIRWHLSGRDAQGRDFVMGVYPMLLDENCFFWRWTSTAKVGSRMRKSFSKPAASSTCQPPWNGRDPATEHMSGFSLKKPFPPSRAQIGFAHSHRDIGESSRSSASNSYDRLFPNQDTLPKGGFGNLIALPLQKQARQRGNSVFLDEQFRPHPDQWAFLASIRRISRARIEALVRAAESKGRIIGRAVAPPEDDDDNPWTSRPSRCPKEPPIRVHCRRDSNWSSVIKSTSQRKPSRRAS